MGVSIIKLFLGPPEVPPQAGVSGLGRAKGFPIVVDWVPRQGVQGPLCHVVIYLYMFYWRAKAHLVNTYKPTLKHTDTGTHTHRNTNTHTHTNLSYHSLNYWRAQAHLTADHRHTSDQNRWFWVHPRPRTARSGTCPPPEPSVLDSDLRQNRSFWNAPRPRILDCNPRQPGPQRNAAQPPFPEKRSNREILWNMARRCGPTNETKRHSFKHVSFVNSCRVV